jgi:DNA polymerase III alpha subunit (gram-positive type)
MVEDIIFNLVHEKDIKQTEQKIEEYKEQNLRSITVNQVKLQQRLADETTTIHEEELFREQREREFQSKMAQELQQKRELRKQQNLALLGEQELTINSSGTFASMMAADGSMGKKDSNATLVETPQPGINPVFAFLNQRPEPKPKESSNNTAPRNKSANTNEMKRKIDAAGGFDYSHYDRRNWTEIKSQLRACSHTKQS